MIDAELAKDEIGRAVQAALLGMDGFTVEYSEQLAACTAADRDRLVLRAAVTYLVANGLITVASVASFGQWLPFGLEPPFADDLRAAVEQGVENLRKINAELPGQSR